MYIHQDWNPVSVFLSSIFPPPIWASYLTSSSFVFFSYKIIKMIHMTLHCEENEIKYLLHYLVHDMLLNIILIFSKFTVNMWLSFCSLNLERILAQFSNWVWPSLTSHIWQPVSFPILTKFTVATPSTYQWFRATLSESQCRLSRFCDASPAASLLWGRY